LPSPAIAFGITVKPSHSVNGFPDGLGNEKKSDCVSVGGTVVWVGVAVDSGVPVAVGKLVSVGVAVGSGGRLRS